MSKTPLPLYVGDISVFARSLRNQFDGLERSPSHVEMLNLLAKAGGFRNFQHLKAQHDAAARAVPPNESARLNAKRVKNALRHFDERGRLIRWPGKFALRQLCLWVMWSHIPARTGMSEAEVNHLLERWHLFEDPALLRRDMVDYDFMERTVDGSRYKRLERQPTAEAMELFQKLRA